MAQESEGAIVQQRMKRVSTRGQVNHVAWRSAIAGGNWNEGARNGARTLNTNSNPWNANGNVGVRGVSDAIAADQYPDVRKQFRAPCIHYGSAVLSQPETPVKYQKMLGSRDTKPLRSTQTL